MIKLTFEFIRIYFRNGRAIFWMILLPAIIFLALAVLETYEVVDFNLSVSYQDFLLPGIIAFAILQNGVYTSAYTLIDYKRSGVLKRLAATPLRIKDFLMAQIAARFLIGLLQAVLLITIGTMFFDTKIDPNILYLPLVIFLGNGVFMGFGFLIAGLARDYEEAAPYSSSIGLGLSFIGDVFFSVQNLPGYLPILAEFLPLKPLAASLRLSILGIESGSLTQDIVVLVVWFGLMLLVSQWVFKKLAYR